MSNIDLLSILDDLLSARAYASHLAAEVGDSVALRDDLLRETKRVNDLKQRIMLEWHCLLADQSLLINHLGAVSRFCDVLRSDRDRLVKELAATKAVLRKLAWESGELAYHAEAGE